MDKKINNDERDPIVKGLGGILLVVGLYFAIILFTDTDGLNFLDYCFPTFVFLTLGIMVLFFFKPSKSDSNNTSDEKEQEEIQKQLSNLKESVNLWPVIIIFALGMLIAIISSWVN